MSLGLIGTFAIPAYGTIKDLAEPTYSYAITAAAPQHLTAENAQASLAAIPALSTEDDPEILRIEAEEEAEALRLQQEAELLAQQAEQAEQAATAVAFADVPAGEGSQGVVDAALAQLGIGQDCTDLVQNALAAAGYTTRRDQGGYDLGTGIWQYDGFGSRVSLDALAPGDILVYGNASSGAHVAIYIGNGNAVHGGVAGGTAILSVHAAFEPLTGAVRPA